jgi:hypothetical protein
MFKSLTSYALITSTLLGLAVLAAPSAMAREGARSVGQGLKCYTAAVLQADGTVKYQQVCYKGV